MNVISKFIQNLELFYPYKGTDENKLRIFDSYVENLEGICISNKCEYDWEKVLLAIQRGYKKREFPLLADIITYLPEGKITKQYKECKGEGCLIVITLPNGISYPFTVSSIGRSKDAVIDEIKTKYGDCDIKMYPKGSIYTGTEVYEGEN